MNFSPKHGHDPIYVGLVLKPSIFKPASSSGRRSLTTLTEHEKWVGKISSFATEVGPEVLEQVGTLRPSHQYRFVSNVANSACPK